MMDRMLRASRWDVRNGLGFDPRIGRSVKDAVWYDYTKFFFSFQRIFRIFRADAGMAGEAAALGGGGAGERRFLLRAGKLTALLVLFREMGYNNGGA